MSLTLDLTNQSERFHTFAEIEWHVDAMEFVHGHRPDRIRMTPTQIESVWRLIGRGTVIGYPKRYFEDLLYYQGIPVEAGGPLGHPSPDSPSSQPDPLHSGVVVPGAPAPADGSGPDGRGPSRSVTTKPLYATYRC